MTNIKYLLFSLALLATTLLTAQPAGKMGQFSPSSGRIFGKVVDQSGKPVSDASVVLLQKKMDTSTKKIQGYLAKSNECRSQRRVFIRGSADDE